MVSPITTPCENEVHTVPMRITGLARTGSGRNGSGACINRQTKRTDSTAAATTSAAMGAESQG